MRRASVVASRHPGANVTAGQGRPKFPVTPVTREVSHADARARLTGHHDRSGARPITVRGIYRLDTSSVVRVCDLAFADGHLAVDVSLLTIDARPSAHQRRLGLLDASEALH